MLHLSPPGSGNVGKVSFVTAIVSFYLHAQPDYLGRWLRDIWQWDNGRLEEIHDFIQVLFPNRELSQVNARASLLDQATIAAFLQNESLRENLATSLDVMLRFYGLEYDAKTSSVVKSGDFPERSRNWIHPCNHNYLRITRILKCLTELGLSERARAFLDCLEAINADQPRQIGLETLGYWRRAVA